MKNLAIKTLAMMALSALCSPAALAAGQAQCGDLPGHAALKTALNAAVATETSGLDFDMWATVVNRDGIVCAVAFSGGDRGAQWPGSRAISAQKANTANAFSLDGLALSTANLFSAVQPGGSLYGLQHSNPVDTGVAYQGPSSAYGQHNDPMVGKKIGGVNVFGFQMHNEPAPSTTTVTRGSQPVARRPRRRRGVGCSVTKRIYIVYSN
jgi:hypothetical protein